ncbi:MAG: hypothetical protein MUF16_06745, partial [Burkholderiaceae bacterium]|nr:hypothetical protein [Burkholderiaceae bacterium]
MPTRPDGTVVLRDDLFASTVPSPAFGRHPSRPRRHGGLTIQRGADPDAKDDIEDLPRLSAGAQGRLETPRRALAAGGHRCGPRSSHGLGDKAGRANARDQGGPDCPRSAIDATYAHAPITTAATPAFSSVP